MIDGHSHPQDVIRDVRHEGQVVVLEVGSELRLAGLCEHVRSNFEICRLESIFQIYDNEAEALSQ
jgi:anti-anti-sigma regulatory factor